MEGQILAGKVLISPIITEKSKILYVVQNQEYQVEGRVEKIGELLEGQDPILSVGDIIITRKHAGINVDIDGETYTLINYSDILFIR